MKKPLFWLVLFGFVAWWLVPFGTHGLFDDGVFYGCISRNWAFSDDPNGWHFVVSPTLDPQFNGHPPMAFWLEAGLFKLLGDHFWIEHLYSLIMAILSGIAMAKIWKKVITNYSEINYITESAYLPLIFWLLIPIVGWSYMNNMLENTLSVFTLWTVYCFIPIKGKNNYSQLAIGGILIFMATLTKGPVGLFPLAVAGLHWLVFRKEKLITVIVKTFYLIIFIATAYWLLITFFPNAEAFLGRYVELQLRRSLAGEGMVTSRWVLPKSLATEPLIALAIIVIGWSVVRLKNIIIDKVFVKGIWFYGLLAISVVLPMLISPKQMAFYLVPAFPYLSLLFGLLFYPIWKYILSVWMTPKWLFYTLKMAVVSGLAVMVFRWGSIGRNHKMLKDVFEIVQTVSPNDTIGIRNDLYIQWNLHGYLYRYGRVNLFNVPLYYNNWLLLPKDDFKDTINYSSKQLECYKLYTLKIPK